MNRVVQFLHDEAFVEPLANRGFRVSAHVPLLKAWTSAYRFDRHVRRNCFSLFKGRELDSRLQALVKDTGANIAYCGYSAADLQAPHVRQAMTWLYVDPDSEERARSALAAKFVDSGENLVLLLSEDAGVFYKTESIASRLSCTNAVQTYVDLVHAGGRGEEAAEALLEQRLLRAWSSAES